jgi:glycosyltransferase involved in cell wall biosynthesis
METRGVRKVLMTADTIGGVWTYAIELCKGLHSYGVEVALATMGASLSSSQKEELDELENITLYESKFKLEWMESPWNDIERSCSWLKEIEAGFKPGLIHLNTFCHGCIRWNAPVLMVAHSDVFSWWEAVKKETAPYEWNEYYNKVRSGLHNADFVAAPSRHMMQMLNENYGSFPAQDVIYNGRNEDDFKYGKKDNFIMSMGRLWDEAKNIKKVVNAAPRLKWQVAVAGEQLQTVTGMEKPAENVTFLGKLSLSQTAQYLSKAGIFVHPAKYEPFGLAPLEAGLSGCALILGDIPSLREIWDDAAVFVDPCNIESLIEKINLLVEDDGLREEFSKRAYRQALKYPADKMTLKYFSLYNRIAAKDKAIKKLESVA